MADSQRKSQQQLFYALSDPTRRGIVELLASKGHMTATEIYENFEITPPGVSQHLKVLHDADIVRIEKSAQRRIYGLNPLALNEFSFWTKRMTQMMDERFEKLDQVLESEKRKLSKNR